jgi:putative membrane protein
MKGNGKIGAGAAGLLLLTGLISAQTADRLKRPDNTFVTNAAQGGIAEVEMGRMAAQKGTNEGVKRFGQHMVDDHSKANEELKGVVSTKGITAPATMNAKQKATMDRLEKLNGSEFDRAYMEDMVKDHQEDVAEFQREANSGTDADVKNFAAKTLPTLQQHLKMAQDTLAQVK